VWWIAGLIGYLLLLAVGILFIQGASKIKEPTPFGEEPFQQVRSYEPSGQISPAAVPQTTEGSRFVG
jgi:hypothetical protein